MNVRFKPLCRTSLFSKINDMLDDIPLTDNRPESEKNLGLLYKAKKRLVKPDLSRPDAVNEKLRGL